MNLPGARPWHCDEPTLAAFVDGTVDPVSGASVETHLLRCGDCRTTVRRLTSPVLLDEVWERVRERVEAPRAGLVERLLRRCGASAETARLLAAVPALRGAWLLAVCTATLFALAAGVVSDAFGTASFLLLAPLTPLAGVAASFGGDADPAHELVETAPYSSLRLLLIRTLGVLGASVPVTVVVGLLLPGPSWLAAGWLAPATAAVAVTLALGPLLGHTVSATVVAASWAMVVAVATRLDSLRTLVEPAVQTGCLLLAVAGTLAVVLHHRPLEPLRRST